MNFDTLRHTNVFHSAYKIGVGIKGIDGLIELVAGLALLFIPGSLHAFLTNVLNMLHDHNGHVATFIATYVARLDHDLASQGITFLIIFLIGHGVVKLALVYCLLRRIVKAYPYALAVLTLFLVYQIYVLITAPTLGMWLLTVLDVLIIWLVWGEYKDLKEQTERTGRTADK